LFAVIGNALLVLVTLAGRSILSYEIIWSLLYFAVMASIFTWITSPPPGFSQKLSNGTRLMAGSCVGALFFMGMFLQLFSSPGFQENVNALLNTFGAITHSSPPAASPDASPDAAQNAVSGDALTAEAVLTFVKSLLLRGGSLVSCVLMFFVCRQISLVLARLSPRERATGVPPESSLRNLHVPPVFIWVLSASLFLVVVSVMTGLVTPEIILWNILILCCILYLAQGMGILLFFFARLVIPPFMRFLLQVLFVIMIFSPGINAVFLGGVVLLGIAENWASFRAPKQNGPPSTPEAGDGEN